MASRPDKASKVSSDVGSCPRRLAIHGPAVEIDCQIPGLEPTIGRMLGTFATTDWPKSDAGVTHGTILPYDQAELARRLPAKAKPLHRPGELTEIYTQDERTWIIDDRWGMSEINILRSQWRSWILPQVQLDAVKLTDKAILWPLALLLKSKGVHLLPAMSVVRNGFALLVLSPFGLEQELAAMLANGYRIVGQRWTAVREEEGRLALLHMPGVVQQKYSNLPKKATGDWVDLTAVYPGASLQRAYCDAVAVVDAGRRPKPKVRTWSAEDASTVLRLSWPIPDLNQNRRQGQLAGRVAQICPCYQFQLSRDPKDLLFLVDSIRSPLPEREAA
jgi:hypothetical protein